MKLFDDEDCAYQPCMSNNHTLHVFVRVCVCVCICTCMHVCLHVRVHVCMCLLCSEMSSESLQPTSETYYGTVHM